MEDNYTLLSITQEKMKLEKELDLENQRHKEFLCNHLQKLNKLKEKETKFLYNLDIKKFDRGMELLDLQFPCNRNPTTNELRYTRIYESLVEDAKKDISSGCAYLGKQYIGQKTYGGFDQRADFMYGYGPNYGCIYQKIGLKYPKKELTEYDRECCLYVLDNLAVVLSINNNS